MEQSLPLSHHRHHHHTMDISIFEKILNKKKFQIEGLTTTTTTIIIWIRTINNNDDDDDCGRFKPKKINKYFNPARTLWNKNEKCVQHPEIYIDDDDDNGNKKNHNQQTNSSKNSNWAKKIKNPNGKTTTTIWLRVISFFIIIIIIVVVVVYIDFFPTATTTTTIFFFHSTAKTHFQWFCLLLFSVSVDHSFRILIHLVGQPFFLVFRPWSDWSISSMVLYIDHSRYMMMMVNKTKKDRLYAPYLLLFILISMKIIKIY